MRFTCNMQSILGLRRTNQSLSYISRELVDKKYSFLPDVNEGFLKAVDGHFIIDDVQGGIKSVGVIEGQNYLTIFFLF